MRNAIALVMTCLFSSSVVNADAVSNGVNIDKSTIKQPEQSWITDRPSADRPKLPTFIPKNSPSFSLPPAEKALLSNQNSSAVKIVLKGVKFIGNTLISDEALQKIAQPFIGKTLSVTELEDLRQLISQYYAEKGYVNSGAVLPNQQLQNGIITLEIIEGKLTEIRVKGTEWLSPSYISKRLYEVNGQPLDIHQLRENFQQLLLDPLIERMNGSLIPSSQRGDSILEVNVTRARSYQLTLTADNHRPPSIGSEEGHLSGWVQNLTGFGDRVDGSIVYSRGALGGSGGFSIPLNSYNTKFNFHFNLNNAKVVEETLKSLNIKSRYVDFEFGLTHPLIQSLNRNLNLGVAFNFKKNKTFLLGTPFAFSEGASDDGISKDSVLRFSVDFTERLEQQVFSARSTTSLGINAFAPTWYQDPSIPDGNFVAWLGQVQYAGQVLDTDATVILRGDVQYSDDKLMTLERFALGGRYSVRGYRENEVVRDKGYVVSAELRYPLLKDEGEKSFPGQLTVFPFMDYGAGWNRGDRQNRSTLHSIGIGLEWQPFKGVNTEIIYAHALKTPVQKVDYDLQDSGIQWRVSLSAF
jgi:hemolysin activation/secretion protein